MRLIKLAISREFKATSPLPPPPLVGLTRPLSRAHGWGKSFHWPIGPKHLKNLASKAWSRHMISELILQRDKLTIPRFYNTLPSRDIHGGPFPPHGKLTQGLSLTMGPIKTASPPYDNSHCSHQKPSYLRVSVRIFWAFWRHVFKHLARYAK